MNGNDREVSFMPAFVLSFMVGVLCIVLGSLNMKGNLSSLHFYHRHRVLEEDRIPFGKKVGFGTVVIGCAIAVFGILSAITLFTENQAFILVGTVILIVGLAVGLGISFYAMIKYNKGIF